MNTPICPTCGCSLVRLGIKKENSIDYIQDNSEYRFCCDGCLDIFKMDPGKYLKEISNLAVCPVCLREKPIELTTKIEHEGIAYHFCRCPYCEDQFTKKPVYYIKRLAGEEIENVSNKMC
ncbi:MAG: hypothetical protein COA77_00265 [Thaumarchaeota archaeon]|nr:MAG: hypothetical protein COA77_00265 [Nitrososphaerota archaeon]